MTLSVAMIFRDHEDTLARALNSIAPFVDELALVDTGSADGSREIATRYTDKISDFAWNGSSSDARNFALSQATGDWILMLDTDEVVVGAKQLRELVAHAPEDAAGFYITFHDGWDQYGHTLLEYQKERLFRRSAGWHYVGKAHEYATPTIPGLRLRSPLVIEHRPTPAKAAVKTARNLDVLGKEIEDAGASVTPRQFFYLGNELRDAQRWNEAIGYYERYLKRAAWADEMMLAHLRIAECQRNLRHYAEAVEAGFKALSVCPTWPQAYFDLAASYYYLQDWPKVIHWCDLGQQMKPPETLVFLNPMDWRFNFLIYYINALWQVGRQEEALLFTESALRLCPNDSWHLYNRAFFTSVLTPALP